MPSTTRMITAALLTCAGLVLAGCGSAGGSGADSQAEQANEDIGEGVEAVVDTPETAKDGVLTVCATFDNPPNGYFTESHEMTGVETDFARVLGPLMGLKTEFHETKFASLIPTIQADQCDVIMASLYIKPEREEVVDFVPYMVSGQSVVVSQDNPKEITGYDDTLCGNKVGFQVSTTAEEYVKEQITKCEQAGEPAIQTIKVDNGTIGMQQVQTGQADAFVDTYSASTFNAGKSNGSLQVVGEMFGPIDIGAAVKKGNTQLQDALSAAFDELVASGTYAEVLENYDSTEMALQD